MEPFTVHVGRAVPLRRSNVDTDQIIPSEYLKRVSRTGFGDGLFAAWRSEPGFILDDPSYSGATILLAGPDFGTGSSREHAVWALQDYGFRAVISERFGDIFGNNAVKNGLLPVVLPAGQVDQLMRAVESDPQTEIAVDLQALEVRAGGVSYSFDIDGNVRHRLLEGLDDIALTLSRNADIEGFEARRAPWLPSIPG